MRTFTVDSRFCLADGTIGSPVFVPHHEKDRFDNEVSTIHFPPLRYRMIHHSAQGKFLQSATIYGGKDEFLKFSSYYSDRDTQAHTVSIRTAIGEFYTSWGDGDCLGVYVPANFMEIATPHAISYLKKVRDLISSTEGDNEVAFLLGVMHVVLFGLKTDTPWLSKAQWEPIKEQLKSNTYPNTTVIL